LRRFWARFSESVSTEKSLRLLEDKEEGEVEEEADERVDEEDEADETLVVVLALVTLRDTGE
jgi:hypothetical protein